ncbi:MAG: transcription antitermination factor NusB [Gammaproteobacteria bacterium]|nr:transcription antitermination factor NusB [Gammaproteobacteria bacterium]
MATASQRHRAREAILQALYQWQLSGYAMREVEAVFRADNDLKRADLAFFHQALVYIDTHYDALVDQLTPHLTRPFQDLTPIERNVLLLGAYELSARIDVPFRVAISEAVALSKKFGATDGHKFVNAVLDALASEVREVEVAHNKSRERI